VNIGGKMKERIIQTLYEYESGLVSKRALVDLAIDMVLSGVETKSLLLLSSLLGSELDRADELFHSSLFELNIHYPSENDIRLYKAYIISLRIIHEQIQPNDGCAELGELWHELDFPDILAEFGHLSHIQNDHENIGITKDSVVEDIIEAVDKFLKE
jgi:hypothetical protein